MTLEIAFELLEQRTRNLRSALDELDVFIADRPERGGDVIVVRQLTEALDDCRGWLEQLMEALATGREAANPIGWEQARRVLLIGQEQFNQMLDQSTRTGLFSFQSVIALMDLGGRRGGEWAEWANIIRQGMEHCRHELHQINDGLFTGWRELTESGSSYRAVEVQTTNIGQQINAGSTARRTAREAPA